MPSLLPVREVPVIQHTPFHASRVGSFELLAAFQQATALHRSGRLWEAEQLYGSILQADSRHFDAISRLGLIRLQQDRFEEAAVLFGQAVEIDGNSAESRHHLAVAMTRGGRPESAIEPFEKALRI